MGQITGLPGYRTERQYTPRRVRRSGLGVYVDGGLIIDGTLSGDAGNTGNVDVLRPGKVMVKKASGGFYRNYILGKSTLAYADNDTTITVGAATATEISRIKTAGGGGNLSLVFVGPPTAAGTVAETALTVTAVDTSAGTITVGDLNLNKVTDSLIVLPAAAITAGMFCLVDDNDFIKLTDEDGVRTDQPFPRPLVGCSGLIDASQIVDWPADTATQDWLKGKLSTTTGAAHFRFDDDV